MDRTGFDPRYSPEFQRGFDPALHDGPSATAASHERIEIVPEPVVRRIPPAPIAAPPTSEARAGASVQDAALEDLGFEEVETADASVSPWRNPYLIGLTVLGVMLIGGGIGGFRWSVNQIYGGAYSGNPTEADAQEAMLLGQLAWGLSPLLSLAGVLTLLGVFFVVALRWRPRTRWADEEPEDSGDGSAVDVTSR